MRQVDKAKTASSQSYNSLAKAPCKPICMAYIHHQKPPNVSKCRPYLIIFVYMEGRVWDMFRSRSARIQSKLSRLSRNR